MADESFEDISTLDLSKLKVPDLKKELKIRGLSTSGNKNELIERLQSAAKSSDTRIVDSIDDIEEDLLNDDDDEHIDERESLINDLEHALDELPKGQKRKSEPEEELQEATGPTKKVILKRNTSESLSSKSNNVKPVETSIHEKDINNISDESEEKKVVKLSELSAKERLEMRAKKFGVTALSDDAKKVARAERFGISSANTATSIKSETAPSIDVLKQRAERFGVSTSSVMSEFEKNEKLEKRKQRFGLNSSTNGDSTSKTEANKAARLERFKVKVT